MKRKKKKKSLNHQNILLRKNGWRGLSWSLNIFFSKKKISPSIILKIKKYI